MKYIFSLPERLLSIMKDHLNFVFGHPKQFTSKEYFEEMQKIVNTEFMFSLDAIAHKPSQVWKWAVLTVKFSQSYWGYEATNLVVCRDLPMSEASSRNSKHWADLECYVNCWLCLSLMKLKRTKIIYLTLVRSNSLQLLPKNHSFLTWDNICNHWISEIGSLSRSLNFIIRILPIQTASVQGR